MSTIFPKMELSAPEAQAIARGLLFIAGSDSDVDERELSLIGDFLNAVGLGESFLTTLQAAPIVTQAELAHSLTSPKTRKLLIKCSLLLAYADGVFRANEIDAIYEIALQLGLSKADVEHLENDVRNHLISA